MIASSPCSARSARTVGGSCVVAHENLGELPALIAAAGLLIDYMLTVAVSISAGIAAITSALPGLAGDTVPLGLGVIALLLAGNLRGVRQAGMIFSAPTLRLWSRCPR